MPDDVVEVAPVRHAGRRNSQYRIISKHIDSFNVCTSHKESSESFFVQPSLLAAFLYTTEKQTVDIDKSYEQWNFDVEDGLIVEQIVFDQFKGEWLSQKFSNYTKVTRSELGFFLQSLNCWYLSWNICPISCFSKLFSKVCDFMIHFYQMQLDAEFLFYTF